MYELGKLRERVESLLGAESKTERCVLCSVDTKVPKNLHIELRLHYIEGAGQVCENCWNEIYKDIQ